MSDDKNKPAPMHSLFDLIKNRAMEDKGGYITREFQDYGYRLAKELEDESHTSLYIKMAKTVDRKILESARTFVLDANARSRSRLFMWKVKELKKNKK